MSKIVAPALALAGALDKLAVPKTAAALTKTFSDVKDVAENGRLAETFSIMKEFGVVMEPIVAPLSLITAKIGEGTIENVIKLSTSLFDLISQPAAQTVFDYMIRFFNNILEGVDRFISFVDKFSEFTTNLAENNPTFAKVVDFVDKIILYIIDFVTYGERAQNFLKIVGDFLKDKFEPMFEPTKTFITQVSDFIEKIFYKFIGFIENDVIPFFQTYVIPIIEALFKGIKEGTEYIWDFVKPAVDWFMEQLGKIEEGFQNLTGIDVGGWITSLVDTIKGWFD